MADSATPRKRAKSVTFATPPPSYRENTAFRTRTAAILAAITLGGYYVHFYQCGQNGLFDRLTALVHSETVPGSNGPFKRVFTGIKPLDLYLSYFTPFFSILTHRADDSSYLYWIWMIGQFGILWALLLMESLREGNKGSVARYVALAGILFQNFGLATVVPAFFLLGTLTSNLSRASSPTGLMKLIKIHSIDLNVLPFSIAIGYFFPTICMMLPVPAINTNESWQGWIATWQFFPLYTAGFQWIFASFFKAVDQGKGLKLKSEEAKTIKYVWAARPIYIGFIAICFLFHANVMAICLLPSWLMEYFPIIGTYHDITFSSVFIPPVPLAPFQPGSLIRDIHVFLQWDIYVSSAAAFVWASLQARNVGTGIFGVMWVLRTLGYTVILGPVGALVMAIWERDSTIVDNLIAQAMKDK